jgi:hypothetical protein
MPPVPEGLSCWTGSAITGTSAGKGVSLEEGEAQATWKNPKNTGRKNNKPVRKAENSGRIRPLPCGDSRSLSLIPWVIFRSQREQNQEKPGKGDKERPPVQDELFKREINYAEGKHQENAAENQKNDGRHDVAAPEGAVPPPSGGQKGQARKNRDKRPGAVKKGPGNNSQSRKEEKKTCHKKKSSEKEVRGTLVKLNCQNRAEDSGYHKKEGRKHGKSGNTRQRPQEKGRSQEHQQKAGNKNEPGCNSAGKHRNHT